MNKFIQTVFACLATASLAVSDAAAKPTATALPAAKPAPAKPAATAKPAAGGATNVLSDEKSRDSYALGMLYGHNWQQQGIEVDWNLFSRGFKDAQSGGAMLLTPQEMRDTLNQFQKTIAARQQELRAQEAAKNKAAGDTFLAANKEKPGVTTLPDGLQYKVITDGEGPMPADGDTVTVNYRGTSIDGAVFDASAPDKPAQLQVGRVIPGWNEALKQMKTGSKWQLFIPSDLAYGPNGAPPRIAPNSALIFDVELLSIQRANPQQAPAPSAEAVNPPLTSDIIKVPSADELKKGAKVEILKAEDVQKLQQQQQQQPSQPRQSPPAN